MLGYQADELVGRSIFKLIHPEDLAAVHSAFCNVIEGLPKNATARFRHRNSDGSYRMVEATVGKLRESAESVVFSLRPLTTSLPGRDEPGPPGPLDLSQAGGLPEVMPPPDNPRTPSGERLEAAATRSCATLLPDNPRTPFGKAIHGIASRDEASPAAREKPEIERIWEKHELSARLREEPLSFSKRGHLKAWLRLEPIDAHEVALSVLEHCQHELAAAQVEVVLYLRAEENIVRADWARLLQVLCDLVTNAAELSTPGGSISIASTNDAPSQLTIEVASQGAATTGNRLALARHLAEAQGGMLTLASAGRARGATFRLTLKTAYPPA